jgi:hypothetical protein
MVMYSGIRFAMEIIFLLLMRKSVISCVIATFILLLVSSELSAKDITYSGRVIDVDTKEPIEGAVVVAEWLEEKATIAGPAERLKDVKETLTDKDGKWSITGPEDETNKMIPSMLHLLGFYTIKKPNFIIFKPGYCPWPKSFEIEACREKIKYSGIPESTGGQVVELPRLKNREDRLRALPGPIAGENALEKQKEFIKLINEESRSLGIPEAYY